MKKKSPSPKNDKVLPLMLANFGALVLLILVENLELREYAQLPEEEAPAEVLKSARARFEAWKGK